MRSSSSRLLQEGGRLLAPATLLAAKLTGQRRWYELCRRLDPTNVAGLQGLVAARGQTTDIPRAFEQAIRLIAACRPDAAEVIKSEFSRSRAQLLQDIVVILVLDQKRHGYFVEAGAADGLRHSNTWLLETDHGWSGILAEPNPASHASIRRSRQARLETRAVFSTSGNELDFLVADDDAEHSGLAGYADSALKRRSGRHIKVSTVTLEQSLTEHAAPELIDYLSLDTEGSEMDVLRGIDLTRRRFNVMTIEHNMVEGKREQIIEYLAPFGYRPFLSVVSAFDVWLAHESVRSRFVGLE